MKINPIRTSVFRTGDSLSEFVIKQLGKKKLKEKDVLAITSKIVSLSENELVPKSKYPNKVDIVKKEADVYLGAGAFNCHLTIKHGILIPSAGIDESNADGDYYILYPKDPFASAKKLWQDLKKHYKIKKLGIILTDSHTTPLRRGVTGISLAHWGFEGVESLIGEKDIFGREMKFTHINHADAIASAAVYLMGETAERKPLCVISDLNIKFSNKDTSQDCRIEPEEDIYLPILRGKT
ncbi:MAG: coenzyme F420-0:L-glutamate ligase [Pseudobdellovibrionaceae bacterium]